METDGRDQRPAESGSEILFPQRSVPDSALPRLSGPFARPAGLLTAAGRARFHSTNNLFAVSTKDGGARISALAEWREVRRPGGERLGWASGGSAKRPPEPIKNQ